MIVNRRAALAFLAALVLAPLAANAAQPTADAPRYALVVYTFRTPGVCPACDRARPVAVRLANEYPIEFAYRDDPSGAALARARNVTAFPTFTVVRRDAAGEREVERWLGAQDVERRIRAAFARRGVKPAPGRARP
ncbi:MAG: thioredoxin family protein [Thermoguttaceae bacterium]|nr:thioredoxin family protein [Thermoguttaceae bacterium]